LAFEPPLELLPGSFLRHIAAAFAADGDLAGGVVEFMA
jgi:hypothetical protein